MSVSARCGVVIALAAAAAASGPAGAATQSGTATLNPARTILTLKSPVDVEGRIRCDGDCEKKGFVIEYRGSGDIPPLPVVDSVVPGENGSRVLQVTLAEPLATFKKLVFVVRSYPVVDPDATREKGEKVVRLDRVEYRIAPDIGVKEPCLDRIRYRTIVTLSELPPLSSITVEVSDPETHESSSPTVKDVFWYVTCGRKGPPKARDAVAIELDAPLPRGRKLDIAVKGVEIAPDGEPVVATTELETKYPADSKSAGVSVAGSYVLNHAGNDSYSVEVNAAPWSWWAGRDISLKPRFEASVASDDLELPDVLHPSFEATYWIPPPEMDKDDPDARVMNEFHVSFEPEYLTDRRFDNQDVGVTVLAGVYNWHLYQPLATRRTRAEAEKKTDAEIAKMKFGHTIEPRLGLEAGSHLRSASEEVEGEGYFRVLAEVAAVLTWEPLVLEASFGARWLTTDEILVDADEPVRTDSGVRSFVSAELGWALGPARIFVKHQSGRTPPKFKKVSATTFGVKVLF